MIIIYTLIPSIALSIATSGTAAQFNIASQTFLAGFSAFNIGQDFTVESWVKYGEKTASQCIWNQALLSGDNIFSVTEHSLKSNQYELRYGPTHVTYRDWMDENGWLVPEDQRAIRLPGAVHHLAITHSVNPTTNNATVRLIINGTEYGFLEAPAIESSKLSALPLIAGACNELSLGVVVRKRFFSGILDEVRFWSYAKTPAEIFSLMNVAGDELYSSGADLSKLGAHYTFDEIDLGKELTDRSAFNRHAARGGGVLAFAPTYVSSPFSLGNGGKRYIGEIREGTDAVIGVGNTVTIDIPSGTTSISLVSGSEVNGAVSDLSILGSTASFRFSAAALPKGSIGTTGSFDIQVQPSSAFVNVSALIVKSTPPSAGERFGVELFGSAGLVSLKKPMPRSMTVEFWVKLKAFTDSALWGIHTNGGSNRAYFGVWNRFSLYFCPSQQVVSLDDWGEGNDAFHVSISYDWHKDKNYTVTLRKNCGVQLNFNVPEACSLMDDLEGSLLPPTFGQEYDGGPSYSDHANAYFTDFRIWDYARIETEVCNDYQMRLPVDDWLSGSVNATEVLLSRGLHSYYPVLSSDVAKSLSSTSVGGLSNIGYQPLLYPDKCTGYRNGKYQYNDTCDADLVCNAGRCGFSRRTGYYLRPVPFAQAGSEGVVFETNLTDGGDLSLKAFDPDNISPLDAGFTSRDDTLMRIVKLPTDCSILMTTNGNVVSEGSSFPKSTIFNIKSSGTITPCNTELEYSAVEDLGGGQSLTSFSTVKLKIKVLSDGPFISNVSIGQIPDSTDVSMVIRFNRPTLKADTSSLDLTTYFNVIGVNFEELMAIPIWSTTGDSIFFPKLRISGSPPADWSAVSITPVFKVRSENTFDATLPKIGVIGDHLTPLCAPGLSYDALGSLCLKCPPGQQPNADNTGCQPCPIGWYKPVGFTSALGLCLPCPPGQFAPSTGSIECSLCPKGSSSTQGGSASCSLCPPGEYSLTDGSPKCDRCPLGTFSDISGRSTNCQSCPSGSTTTFPGSRNITDCGCPKGSFHPCQYETDECDRLVAMKKAVLMSIPSYTPGEDLLSSTTFGNQQLNLGSNFCELCHDDGVECPGGFYEYTRGNTSVEHHAPPMAKPSYMLMRSRPFDSFLCKSGKPESACPGGPPGTCGPTFDPRTPACGKCLPDHYKSAGECIKCSGTNIGWWIFAGIVLVGFLYFAHYILNRPGSGTVMATIQLSCTAGITLSMIQSMSILGSLEFDFPLGLGEVFSVLKFFVFDFELLQVECTFGSSFKGNYLARTFIPLAIGACLFGTYPVKKLLSKIPFMPVRVDRHHMNNMINFIGTLVTALYITLSKSTFVIFECYEHPNGEKSLVSFPNVLCSDDEVVKLLPVGVILVLIYVVGIPLWFTTAILRGPQKCNNEDFRMRYRFLFFKFRQDRFYWGVPVLIRSLLISITAMIFAGNSFNQAVWMSWIFLAWIILTLVFLPWRDSVNNVLDVFMMSILLILSILAMRFVNFDAIKGDNSSDVSSAMGALMASIAAYCAFVFVMNLRIVFETWSDVKKKKKSTGTIDEKPTDIAKGKLQRSLSSIESFAGNSTSINYPKFSAEYQLQKSIHAIYDLAQVCQELYTVHSIEEFVSILQNFSKTDYERVVYVTNRLKKENIFSSYDKTLKELWLSGYESLRFIRLGYWSLPTTSTTSNFVKKFTCDNFGDRQPVNMDVEHVQNNTISTYSEVVPVSDENTLSEKSGASSGDKIRLPPAEDVVEDNPV